MALLNNGRNIQIDREQFFVHFGGHPVTHYIVKCGDMEQTIPADQPRQVGAYVMGVWNADTSLPSASVYAVSPAYAQPMLLSIYTAK